MRTCAWIPPIVLVALVGLSLVRGRDDDDPEKKEKRMKTAAARVDVLKLLDHLGGKEDDLRKQAGDIAKKHDLEFVMSQFKPREDGGLGVGPMPGAVAFDCVETELLFLSKKPLPPDKLTAQKADLQKMAEAALAVAYTTPNYAPKKDDPGMPIKDWLRMADDMKKESKDLIEAVQGGDPTTVRKAAAALNSSCESCHSEFRDK